MRIDRTTTKEDALIIVVVVVVAWVLASVRLLRVVGLLLAGDERNVFLSATFSARAQNPRDSHRGGPTLSKKFAS